MNIAEKINTFLMSGADTATIMELLKPMLPDKAIMTSNGWSLSKNIYIDIRKSPRLFCNKIITSIEIKINNKYGVEVVCSSTDNNIYKCSLNSMLNKIMRIDQNTINAMLEVMAFKIELTVKKEENEENTISNSDKSISLGQLWGQRHR